MSRRPTDGLTEIEGVSFVRPSQIPSIHGNSTSGSFSIAVSLFAYRENIILFYFISDFLVNESTGER
jgi:hypothetical protein